MELRLYIQMLLRSWWIVLLTALVAIAVALALVVINEPIFRSTARFVVSPNLAKFSGDDTDVLRSLEALDKRSIIATYAEVINSERIFRSTVVSMGLSAEDIERYESSTVVLPDANILELSAEGPDPRVAANLVNNLGQGAIDYINQLYTVYEITFMDTASPASIPVRPQPIRDTGFALALGLIMGAVLAIIREQLRTPLEAFMARTQIDTESNAYNRRYFEGKLGEVVAGSSQTLVTLGLVSLDGLPSYLQVLPQPLIQQFLRNV